MNLQKIAKLAGVSPSTVSRVFSHHPRISEEVRQRVLALAEEYNYHPKLAARQRNIVILTPDESGYPAHYCVEVLVIALSGELAKHNFRVEILPWHSRKRLDNIQFYGAAAVGLQPEEFQDWNRNFAQPLVVLDRELPKPYPGVWEVSSNEKQAMQLAVSHLRERGLEKIGCLIYGEAGVGKTDLRFRYARAALRQFNYPCNDELLFIASQSTSVELVGKLLSRGVDALLCPGQSGGLLTAYALSLFGKRIPQDISLISTEISFFSPYSTPPQTTLNPDYPRLAGKAVEVFQAFLAGEHHPARTILPYSLIQRESVR